MKQPREKKKKKVGLGYPAQLGKVSHRQRQSSFLDLSV